MFTNMSYIYEVYKERSFSKAAQNLFISQPSLSATVRRTEKEIGTPVFDRSTSPISLTECGAEYIKCIEKIMDIENGFRHYLNDVNHLLTGQLTLGGSNFFTSFVLPPILKSFSSSYPQIRIALTEGDSPLLEEKLARGDLDLILDNTSFSTDLYTRHFYCVDHLLLAVPSHFASLLPEESRMYFEDVRSGRYLDPSLPPLEISFLENLPYLLLKSGNDTRYRTDSLFQKYSLHPQVLLELDQQATAYHLACYGMGCTIVSDQLILNAKNDADICFYHLNDEITIQNVYFYHKKSKYITNAMSAFLQEAEKVAGI